MREWLDEEQQFIKDAEKNVVLGVCDIGGCENIFVKQFGHDSVCQECKDFLSDIF